MERQLTVTAAQREIFDSLAAGIKTLTDRVNLVFATICAGHAGLEEARFVRWGESNGRVHQLVVSIPQAEKQADASTS